jgi:hypothetical protein
MELKKYCAKQQITFSMSRNILKAVHQVQVRLNPLLGDYTWWGYVSYSDCGIAAPSAAQSKSEQVEEGSTVAAMWTTHDSR